jgi:hypothetical protein
MTYEHLEDDLGIAAFLVVKGFRLLGLQPGNGGHFSFRFEDMDGRAQQTAMDYLHGDPISAREFVAAEKTLKTVLYSAKGRNGNSYVTHSFGNRSR